MFCLCSCSLLQLLYNPTSGSCGHRLYTFMLSILTSYSHECDSSRTALGIIFKSGSKVHLNSIMNRLNVVAKGQRSSSLWPLVCPIFVSVISPEHLEEMSSSLGWRRHATMMIYFKLNWFSIKPHQWASVLEWVLFFFMILNIGTEVFWADPILSCYFEFTHSGLICCLKKSIMESCWSNKCSKAK